jgi:hypothetical protein
MNPAGFLAAIAGEKFQRSQTGSAFYSVHQLA